jgi:hypothetical protein
MIKVELSIEALEDLSKAYSPSGAFRGIKGDQ